jgi:hypothetical protein
MQFSEADGPWQPLPAWADFLIKYGFAWGDSRDRRRIGLISMPCESAGAGLVALGAIRRRLALPDASDSLSHFQRIEKLAGRCDNETFLRHDTMKGRFRLDGKDLRGLVWARRVPSAAGDPFTQDGLPRVALLPHHAGHWRLEREAPTEALQGAGLPYEPHYTDLVDGAAAPLPSNLAQSDSAICLAGRVAGESVSRNAFAAIRLECAGQVADLTQLLTVHRWSPDTVSRVTFFNSRTGQLDRNTGSTDLVVADGDSAFLKALDADAFGGSDVLGVIHRAVERDRLESVSTKLGNLSQWFAPDDDIAAALAPLPTGITVLTLMRRAS